MEGSDKENFKKPTVVKFNSDIPNGYQVLASNIQGTSK